MRRVIFNTALEVGLEAELDQSQLHYLFDVLRLSPGQKIIAIDPGGAAFVGKLGARSGSTCLITELTEESGREPDLAVDLFVPLLKGDKLDLVIQKSVELGVSNINLYLAERSVVKPSDNLEKKIIRMQKIAKDATQQCGRHRVPIIQGLFSLDKVGSMVPGIFAWEKTHELSLGQCLQLNPPSGRLSLLTGPEGGLSSQEAQVLLDAGWKSVSLGSRILRAETAAITILAITMFACGEMG